MCPDSKPKLPSSFLVFVLFFLNFIICNYSSGFFFLLFCAFFIYFMFIIYFYKYIQDSK